MFKLDKRTIVGTCYLFIFIVLVNVLYIIYTNTRMHKLVNPVESGREIDIGFPVRFTTNYVSFIEKIGPGSSFAVDYTSDSKISYLGLVLDVIVIILISYLLVSIYFLSPKKFVYALLVLSIVLLFVEIFLYKNHPKPDWCVGQCPRVRIHNYWRDFYYMPLTVRAISFVLMRDYR